MGMLLARTSIAPQASSCFSTKYTVDHVTYVSKGAGGTTNSSRYMEDAFPCGYMRSVYFLCSFVTFTVCWPSSHNSSSKLRQMLLSVLLGGGGPPAIPSPTGFIPFCGCSTQQCTPTWRRSCDHQGHAIPFSHSKHFRFQTTCMSCRGSFSVTQFYREKKIKPNDIMYPTSTGYSSFAVQHVTLNNFGCGFMVLFSSMELTGKSVNASDRLKTFHTFIRPIGYLFSTCQQIVSHLDCRKLTLNCPQGYTINSSQKHILSKTKLRVECLYLLSNMQSNGHGSLRMDSLLFKYLVSPTDTPDAAPFYFCTQQNPTMANPKYTGLALRLVEHFTLRLLAHTIVFAEILRMGCSCKH